MENLKTIKEFAKLAKVSHQAIYSMVLNGGLPYTLILGKKAIDLNNDTIKNYLTDKGITIN